MVRLVARGGDGVVCIHEGAADVVEDPLLDLSRVRFHSSLDYPVVVETRDGSTLMGQLPAKSTRIQSYNLFAHGRPGIPLVLGYVSSLGNGRVPLAGSVPTAISNGWSGRFITLGANATHVLLHEYATTGFSQALPAQTFQWSIAICDVDVSAAADTDPVAPYDLKITADHMVLSRGKFDSDNRYIRAATGGMPMPHDRTLRMISNFDWQYAMDGHVMKSNGTPSEPRSTRVTW